jgi:hypothetical protein
VGLVLALLGVGGWRWVTRGKVASVAPLTSASSVAPTAAAGAEGLPRSSNPEAQRFFEEALRSFHDGTGQFVPLLQKSVQTDPTFGGAYLRLWAVTRGDSDPGTAVYHEAGREHADEYHQRLIALEGTLSPRDRAFLQCIDAPTVDLANAKLDEYLARYPDDDIAWQERFDEMPETADRALVADPTLVPALANKARHSPLTSPGSAAFRSA